MRIADGLPNIICDQDRIMQVLINLISNAVKFTVKGSVTCRAYRSGGEIEVSVSDTGVGINSEDKEKIFGKFKQAGDSLIDKPQGTGLGLPISKEIVEHHGGSIWVESKKGSGSTFIFTLPVHRPLPIENKVALQEVVHRVADQVEAAVPDPQEKNQRILIVDDEAHVRKYLRQELETEGYVVHAAQDGKEAMVFLNQHKPDLIVLDVLLPGINGFDVAEILKKSPNTSEIPIIILSVAEDKWRGYQVGVERYYLEPVNMSALLNEIGLLI
jgi:CheY-like chemotaxis protein/anti-sigma regulatory factor (Ser/Thr protein kinase)